MARDRCLSSGEQDPRIPMHGEQSGRCMAQDRCLSSGEQNPRIHMHGEQNPRIPMHVEHSGRCMAQDRCLSSGEQDTTPIPQNPHARGLQHEHQHRWCWLAVFPTGLCPPATSPRSRWQRVLREFHTALGGGRHFKGRPSFVSTRDPQPDSPSPKGAYASPRDTMHLCPIVPRTPKGTPCSTGRTLTPTQFALPLKQKTQHIPK